MRARFPLYARCLFAAAALFSGSAAVQAQPADSGTSEWVLAASRFESADIPDFFSGYAEAVPLMVLQRLSGNFTRNIQVSETRARELQAWGNGLDDLIKARTELVQARDNILFDTVSAAARAKRRKAADKKIRSKEEEIREYQAKAIPNGKDGAFESESPSGGTPTAVTLWQSGTELFEAETGTTGAALSQAGIHGLLTGTLEDAAGYLVITVKLDTGLSETVPLTAEAAGAYEDLDRIIDTLSASVKTTLSFVEPVRLRFAIEPQEAAVFVDGSKLAPGTSAATVPAGIHTIEASAPGYLPSSEERLFSGSAAFMVNVSLRKEILVPVGFSSSVTGSMIYLENTYVGETPLQTSVSPRVSLGLSVAGGVPTWFYLDATNPAPYYRIEDNKIKTKTLIEQRRSLLYWSLGALYISLPFAMLTNGITQDKLRAYDAGYLSGDQKTANEINSWYTAANIMTGVSIGLGVNYVFQLVRYLLAADKALPQRAKPAENEVSGSGE